MRSAAVILAMLPIPLGLANPSEPLTDPARGGDRHKTAASLRSATGGESFTSLAVSNHSFELPAIPAGTFSTTAAPPGWAVYGNGINLGNRTIGVLHPATTTLYVEPTPDGQNVGVTFLLDNPADQTYFAGIEAGLQQTLADTLQTRWRYTLRVEVGNIANDPRAPYQFDGFPNYRIDLMAGASVLGSDNNSLLPGEGRYLTSTVTVNIGASHPLAGQALGIRLVNLNSATGIEVNWDNVRLEAGPIQPPVLLMTKDALLGLVNLHWADTIDGPFVAESTGSLTDPVVWEPLPAPVLNAGTWSVSIPTPAGPRFFRLTP